MNKKNTGTNTANKRLRQQHFSANDSTGCRDGRARGHSSAATNNTFQELQMKITPRVIDNIGCYRILEKIGSGGMGKVYKAHHRNLDRVVAIKVMLAGDDISPRQRERFMTEARIMAKLRHPNIVQVYDVAADDDMDYIVMDFIEGASLAQLLCQSAFALNKTLHLLHQILKAVDYAHQNGVIHRDLKPGNILIRQATEQPLVMDFGLAKDVRSSADMTKSGDILGTPRYMAPEQVHADQKRISPNNIPNCAVILFSNKAHRRRIAMFCN